MTPVFSGRTKLLYFALAKWALGVPVLMPLLGASQEVAQEGRPDVPSGASFGARKNCRRQTPPMFLRRTKDSALAFAFGNPKANR